MPKVKKDRVYIKSYTEENLQKALAEVRAGAPKKTIAKKYGIPRQTIQFRLSGSFTKIKHGPNTYLTQEEENNIVDWIVENQRKGFPRRKMDIKLSVKSFLDADGRDNPFKDNLPGEHWFNLFLKRHPTLTSRTPESVSFASGSISERDIRGWFREIEEYLKQKGLFFILEDASRVFNGDESGFLFCPKLGKVIAPKGCKNVYEVDVGDPKQNLTVMFSFSAAGVITPPMIIYPNKRLPKALIDRVPEDWGIGRSDNGWMTGDVFIDYIKNVFHPFLTQNNIQFPVILFLDGHRSHLTYQLSQLCSELEIILIALYPNCTHILQPADVSCFKPLKGYWKQAVLEWRKEYPLSNLSKEHFGPVLKNAISFLKPNTLINGFRACGLYPWNANAIDFTKCLGMQNPKDNVPGEPKPIGMNDTTFKDQLQNKLTFNQFEKLVGSSKIEELKIGKCNNFQCDDFEILQKLYKFYSSNAEVDHDPSELEQNLSVEEDLQCDVSGTDEHGTREDSTEVFSEEDILGMPVMFSNASTIQENHTGNIVVTLENQLIRGADLENTNFTPAEITTCAQTAGPESILDHEKFVGEVDRGSEVFPQDEDGFEKENITETVANTDSTIKNYLPKVLTPQRKGKRESKRVPFVLTSSAYKQIMEEKEKAKIDKEMKKEENKQKRLERKLEKERLTKEKKAKRNNLRKNKKT